MPPEENLPQNPIPEENPSPVSPQEPTKPATENTAYSEPSNVPSEALESSKTSVDAIPVNNANSAQNGLEATMPESRPSLARELLIKARNAIQFRKRKKLDRILDLFAKRTNITNDEVEKYLHVSDATATRYLSQLVKEGKIKQTGKTGKAVSYSRI